jgi:pimeloyl-ACP methyl ester carboxylesterase
MAFATNSGVRIHYEIEGSGQPLVLHHGSFASGADWGDLGYVDALKREHLLILMDARGHGASDKPHDPAAYDRAGRKWYPAAIVRRNRLAACQVRVVLALRPA